MFLSSRTGVAASAICKRAGMRRPAVTGRFSLQPAVTAASNNATNWQTEARRSLFGFGGGAKKDKQKATAASTSTPVLSQDDLFHPVSLRIRPSDHGFVPCYNTIAREMDEVAETSNAQSSSTSSLNLPFLKFEKKQSVSKSRLIALYRLRVGK